MTPNFEKTAELVSELSKVAQVYDMDTALVAAKTLVTMIESHQASELMEKVMLAQFSSGGTPAN